MLESDTNEFTIVKKSTFSSIFLHSKFIEFYMEEKCQKMKNLRLK